MRFRPIDPTQDGAAVAELVGVVASADGQAPLSEHKYAAVTSERPRPRSPGFVGEVEGTALALAAVVPASAPREWGLELALHPLHRRPEVVDELIRLAVAAVEEHGGGRLRLWSYGDQPVPDPAEYGFRPERRLHRMERDLPAELVPSFPPGVEVRPFVPGRDDEAWLEVNNAAFAGHPENGGWGLEDLGERMDMAWFDPDGFRLAWDGEDLAGFCWTKVHPDGAGEIYVIAAAPSHHGRGLGKALVMEGIRHLSDTGVPRVFLFCEADNTRAMALYERLGFVIERTHRASIRVV
jgi:mycothiol synthase